MLWSRMFDPGTWTGIAQFGLDFTPLPAIMFRTVWGSDRDNEGAPRPLDNTSYGHNIEFLWLFLHALEVLGESVDPYRERLAKLAAHTLKYGVDPQFTAGSTSRGRTTDLPAITQKEFWQQAESLVGLARRVPPARRPGLLGRVPLHVFDFVWRQLINHDLGEWYALAERDGTIRWDYLGHAWKNNYHTTRSMVQVLKRLRKVEERGLPF